MQELPLNADVDCTDGRGGKSTHVIFDPQKRTVTHIVVKDPSDPDGADRMVPLENVVSTEQGTIRLNFTRGELAGMPLFSGTQILVYTYDDYSIRNVTVNGPLLNPTPTVAHTEVVHTAIPSGQRAVRYGANVEATDGAVGKVGELLLDPDSGQITHFTLQDGNFWGKKEITLPVSVVRMVEEDTVFLKLDKRAIETLPALPVRRKFAKGDRSGGVELVARVFDAPNRAAEALEHLKDVQRMHRGALKIRSAALIVKDEGGNVTITETGDLSPTKRSMVGAVVGGLLGVLAGPAGLLIGAAAGASVGRVSTRWIDLGLPDDFLQRLHAHLQPNSSAFIVLVEHEYLHQVFEAMASLQGVVLQHTLIDVVVQELLEEQAT